MARAKKLVPKNSSLSAIVEEYLDKFSKNEVQQQNTTSEPSLTVRIRKYRKDVKLPGDYLYTRIW